MADTYFVYVDGEQKGPLRLDQLAEAGVRPSTYVWTQGMEDWQRADEVPEVCRLFRQHLAEKMHPTTAPPKDVTEHERPEPRQREITEDDLSDVPQSFRGFVRKSGTTPGPMNDMGPDISQPPQVSMALAVLSLLVCCVPAGILAVYFTYKAQKSWNDSQLEEGEKGEAGRRQAHEFARLSKMWLGISVAFGVIAWGVFLTGIVK